MEEMKYQKEMFTKVLAKGTRDGFRWCIVNYGTHPCAYVAIPKNHPLYGKSYSQHCDCLMPLRKKVLEQPIGKRGIIPVFCWDGETASMDVIFNVHGGITYSAKDLVYNPIMIEDVWWIGWDYSHAGDYFGYFDKDEQRSKDKKWTTEEIKREVMDLIRQLKKVRK